VRTPKNNNRAALTIAVALVVSLAASAAAALGWARPAMHVERPARSIRIIDVRPLRTSDPGLRDLITHTFAVRVAIRGWKLLPHRPGATASDNRPRAGHWRLYLDGFSLGDDFGDAQVTYTPYLTPGTHWIAAELSNADATSLHPAVWSEPVVLHVPRVIRCWQTGWRGPLAAGTPTFTCKRGAVRRLPRAPLPLSSSLPGPRSSTRTRQPLPDERAIARGIAAQVGQIGRSADDRRH
jgi:hypothetical protein